MNKKQTKILKIFSLITLSAGAIGGTSAALISCNNNKETPFAIKTAIIDSTGTKITLTYNGNIPSDFANNLKVKKDDKNLDKSAWHISGDNLTISLTIPATKDNKLYILYNDQTIYVNTGKLTPFAIKTAIIDSTGTKITFTYNGNIPSDFANNLKVKEDDKILDKSAWHISGDNLTITLTIPATKDNKLYILYNEQTIYVNTDKISESVALLTTNGTRVSLTVADAAELNTNVALIFANNNLQRKDISVITVYDATVASAFSLTANAADQDNDNWGNLETIDLSKSNATSIRQVIHDDSKFNGNIIFPTNLTTIGDRFLEECSAFNQLLILPNSITSINDYFLSNCSAFNQPLILPNSITSIGGDFLSYCHVFNQPLILPNSITSIGNSFLYNCFTFNQPLTLSNSITSISDNFLFNCSFFNQPLTLPNSITSIGGNLLSYCNAFNQPLTLSNSITSIKDNFLLQCKTFNQPLTLSNSLTSIGSSFLYNCYAFNNNNTVFNLSNLNSNIVIQGDFLEQTILENINIGSLSASSFIASDGSFTWLGFMPAQNLYVKGDHASDLVGKFPPTYRRNLVVKQ